MSAREANRREFLRVAVDLVARYAPVSPADAERVAAEIDARPSVWATSEEAVLHEMAWKAERCPESHLARAVLELTEQVAALRARYVDAGGPRAAGRVTRLSGSGGQIDVQPALASGDLIDMRLGGDGVPAVRALARIVHGDGAPLERCGFRFEAIHPDDRERLVQYTRGVERLEVLEKRGLGREGRSQVRRTPADR